MTRKEWVKDLLSQGRTDEEIIEIIEKGDKKNGINPAGKFAKLVFAKIKKSIKK